jgi:hypothetical protein
MSPGDHPLNRSVSIVQDMKALDDNPVFMWTQQKIEAAMKSVEPLLEIEASRDHDCKDKSSSARAIRSSARCCFASW